jgi:hypothetical protein
LGRPSWTRESPLRADRWQAPPLNLMLALHTRRKRDV